MAEPFVGEIRMFAGNFAPVGWALCQGQILSIADNSVLFQLIGTTYGGDGVTTFALPDLRGRMPIHMGQSLGTSVYSPGQQSGLETISLTADQMPLHNHLVRALSSNGTQPDPGGAIWAASSATGYSSAAPGASMAAGLVSATGGGHPHENRMPYLAINFIIALFGIFPSQN